LGVEFVVLWFLSSPQQFFLLLYAQCSKLHSVTINLTPYALLTTELLCCFAQDIQESCQARPQEAEASTSKGGMFKPVNLTYLLCCI